MENYEDIQARVPGETEKAGAELVAQAPASITCDEELTVASNFLNQVGEYLKRAEDKRRDLVKPLNDTVKKINDWFKQATEKAKAIDAQLRSTMAIYHKQKLEEAQAAQFAAVEQSIQTGSKLEIVQQPTNQVNGEVGSSHFRDNWMWELVDIKLIPVRLLMTNGPEITKAVKGGLREIPGIRIYNEPIIARGGGRNV